MTQQQIPVLPIRNTVLFPGISMPLVVGRPRSLQAIDRADSHPERLVLVVTQRIMTPGDPEPSDLYRVGTLCRLEQGSAMEFGSRQVVLTGVARFNVTGFHSDKDGTLLARGDAMPDVHSLDPIRSQALLNSLKTLSREILELLPGATEGLGRLLERIDDASYLANVCASYLNLTVTQKQDLLEEDEVERRIELLMDHMRKEREVLNLQREIRDKMSERMSKAQREVLLREQLKTIRTELGEEAGEEAVDDLEKKLQEAKLPEEAKKQATEELNRLRALPSMAAEYHVVRTYLEWLAAIPWSVRTEDVLDLKRAREVLERDHFGLENVKRRILQFLAVAKLKNNLRGPILCLVGPPGVGKTSLGQSIAEAVGRKYIRTSLGGVRDEAEIRGHRRTYVGAMPGRIIQSLKRVGTRNPVMILDEIDKLRADFHGDPASAMLEVLDPEQNNNFVDHYIDIPFDLSDVFFVATANVLDTIPPALRDRMEVIEVNGYTTWEKMQIAMRHLLPREIAAHGLSHAPGPISGNATPPIEIPEETIAALIHDYTREAGVRELTRQIAALLRAVAEEIIDQPTGSPVRVGPERLESLLGPQKYFVEQMERRRIRPGVATGLAWTSHGGDILYIEATRMPGRGSLILTGHLGDVMKESAQIALSLARANPSTHLDFAKEDLHIHVPAGAIPKDGPSAGISLFVALQSLLLGKTLDPEMAFTGEITLRGTLLPVGGIKEKVLAAHRAQLKRVVLPKRNEKDLREVPEPVRSQLEFIFAETTDEVMRKVFDVQSNGSSVRRIFV